MATLTTKSTNGTSFQGHTVTCSVNDLIAIVGRPQGEYNNGRDKTNFDWDCENDHGDVFTIYDWKEGRALDLSEYVEFHIGAHSHAASYQAMIELNDQLYLATKAGQI
jgi:hypothetical protein